jgi:hypothetical protein
MAALFRSSLLAPIDSISTSSPRSSNLPTKPELSPAAVDADGKTLLDVKNMRFPQSLQYGINTPPKHTFLQYAQRGKKYD